MNLRDSWWNTEHWKIYEHLSHVPRSRVDELRAATWSTRVIGLLRPEVELRAQLRRSYKAEINAVERQYSIAIGLPGDIVLAREVHHLCAGRKTRPDSTWALMGEWIAAGHGLLVLARAHSGEVADFLYCSGFVYFVVWNGWAYYMSAASESPNVNKALVWSALLELKARGVREAELGWQGHDGDNEKEQAIAFFKRGFGGVDVPIRDYYGGSETLSRRPAVLDDESAVGAGPTSSTTSR